MAFTRTLSMIIVFVSLLQAQAARTPEARVWALCKPATNPLACYKTILPHAVSAKRFNMYNALETEILATQQQVQTTSERISWLLGNPATDKSTKDSLATCQEQYSSIVDSIHEAIALVAKRNVGEARFQFSAVISFQSSCDDEFEGETSPIAKESQAVFDLAGNCLDIMKAIEDRESRHHGGTTGAVPTNATGPCHNTIGTCA
ncbi:uncharacterized protein LOC109788934 [Cajanus cajan]|uniref:Pectinesterase inhibitor domain-containing protein n=1 Tax=Cajanus cajan TaxID=3821 RepID=A0A151R9C3_CAJCA|nr:uncharacterized protein LOC109788934 [Cajanus cajan]KYP39093.1 hypothetical protein KK1_039621 [Cajanus cajan]